MNVTGRSKYTSRASSRSRVIIGLLVASLLLVIALAWQAQQATRSHYSTATNVLKEYAMLVADEYSRRAMGNVGYYGYYTHINTLRRQAAGSSEYPFEVSLPNGDSAASRAAEIVAYPIFLDAMDGELSMLGDPPATTATAEYITRRASEFLAEPLPEGGFLFDHAVINGQPHTFVFTRLEDNQRVFGFEVDRTRLAVWLEETFNKETLLPQSLADGAITNEYVYLQFVDNTENILFETGPDYDPYLRISKSLHDEYSGIFRGHTISVAIDPAIAESLVIGGLPRTRLPLLVLVMVVTVGLLIAAIRQLQRESAVMQLRTNFVSEVSHELRTPLTQIRMFTETLLFDRVRSDDDRRRALEIINRESQRLIHLVENVLHFSDGRSDQRRLRVERQDLAAIIEAVVGEFQPLAVDRKAQIDCHLARGAVAECDGDAVRQMLLNLLDNAIKYGPSGQRVVVNLTEEPGRVLISVDDEGPGVPRDERERIWGGYYRLGRERKSAIAGTGIGLAVVRELASRHGGRTWVEQRNDGGARFIIELPTSARTKTSPEKGHPSPRQVAGEKG